MDELAEVLGVLNGHNNFESMAIVRRDGLLMKATSGNKEKFAAMIAIVLGAAETALSELGKGLPERIIVDTQDGRIVIMGAGSEALVAALIKPDPDALVEMEMVADKIRTLL